VTAIPEHIPLAKTGDYHRSPKWAIPTLVVVIVCVTYVGAVLVHAHGDPLAFALLGTRFSTGEATGSEGYDGQFAYYIARDPLGAVAHLDVPSYRYQRILYPLLAHILALGQAGWIPWTLIAINIAAIGLGSWAAELLLMDLGVSRWYALAYGLYSSQLLALRADLNEPLAMGLVVWAMVAWHGRRRWLATALFGAAILSKETAIIFLTAYILYHLGRRMGWVAAGLGTAAVPFVLYQCVLWICLGSPGVGSGGAGATPFSPIPFGGWLAIASTKLTAFILVSLIVVPVAVLPGIGGVAFSLRDLFRRESHPLTISLLLNSLVIMFLPTSTFREPGAMLRLSGGLMASWLFYGGLKQSPRILNYSLLWIVTDVLLLKGTAGPG
jgi:hypothetical protein